MFGMYIGAYNSNCACCFALFVCLTLLASFFLPSHLSFKNMYLITLSLVIAQIILLFITTYIG